MRSTITKLAAAALLLAGALLARAQVNPGNQIAWPSGCTSGLVYSPYSNTCVSAGSGSGGGLLPSNANYAYIGTSIVFDDTHVLAATIPISGWTTTAGVTTVTNTGTNNLAAGQWVDMWSSGPWPVNGTYESGTGTRIFQVLSTGLSGTQFEINTSGISAGTCSSSCGDAYSANAYIPYAAAAAPGMPTSAYANTYAWCAIASGASNCTMKAAASSMADILSPLEPGTTGQPLYVILDSPLDDLVTCVTPTTIEGYYDTALEAIHAAGGVAVVASVTNTNSGTYGLTCPDYYIYKNELNEWLRGQGKQTVLAASPASTAYWDIWTDWAQVMSDASDTNIVASNGGAGPTGAKMVGATMAADLQSGGGRPLDMTHQPTFYGIGVYGSGGSTGNNGWVHIPTVDGTTEFQWWNAEGTYPNFAIGTSSSGSAMAYAYGGFTVGNPGAFGSLCNQGGLFCIYGASGAGYSAGEVFSENSLGQGRFYNFVNDYSSMEIDPPLIYTYNEPGSGDGPYCLQQASNGDITNTGSACGSGSGGGLNGTVTYTSAHTVATSDAGKLVIMNCSASCALTLPATQPSTTWNAWVVSMGTTVATIALGGSDTFNGSTSVPVLNSFRVMPVWANSATTTDYDGDAPLVAGTNVTLTPSSNGLSVAASGSGGSGSSVTVNGGSTLSTANLNGTSPAAGSDYLNVTWQESGSNVSAEVPYGTSSAPGVLECGSGTSCTAGVISVSGGGSGCMSPMQVTVGVAQSSISFTSIPSTCTDLTLTMNLANSSSGSNDDVEVQVNGDSGSHYNWVYFGYAGTNSENNDGTGASAGHIGFSTPLSNGGGGTTTVCTISNYTSVLVGKSFTCTSAGPYYGKSIAQFQYGTQWQNGTGALSSITLTLQNGDNFSIGDVATLRGQ